jgi:hypothetical protein
MCCFAVLHMHAGVGLEIHIGSCGVCCIRGNFTVMLPLTVLKLDRLQLSPTFTTPNLF